LFIIQLFVHGWLQARQHYKLPECLKITTSHFEGDSIPFEYTPSNVSMATTLRTEEHRTNAVTRADFQVAIVGGGIGGLSIALALAAYNLSLNAENVTVYEQASTYSDIGAGIAIGIQAARVLQKLGVWESVDAISGHRSNVHRSNRRWDNDELIADAPAAASDGRIQQMWLHRGEFLEVLYSEIKRKQYAKLEVDKKVVKVKVGVINFRLEALKYFKSFLKLI
jgi:hypothetical protein